MGERFPIYGCYLIPPVVQGHSDLSSDSWPAKPRKNIQEVVLLKKRKKNLTLPSLGDNAPSPSIQSISLFKRGLLRVQATSIVQNCKSVAVFHDMTDQRDSQPFILNVAKMLPYVYFKGTQYFSYIELVTGAVNGVYNFIYAVNQVLIL